MTSLPTWKQRKPLVRFQLAGGSEWFSFTWVDNEGFRLLEAFITVIFSHFLDWILSFSLLDIEESDYRFVLLRELIIFELIRDVRGIIAFSKLGGL